MRKLKRDNDLATTTQARKDAKKRKRKELKLLNNESVWLQKALFALQKAETARDKLADHRGVDEIPFEAPRNGADFDIEVALEAIENRVRHLLDTTQERRRAIR